MSAIADPPRESATLELQSRIPAMDGKRAQKLVVRFVGVVNLNRTNAEHLDFIEALELGEPVRVLAIGQTSGKGFNARRTKDDEEEVEFYCSLRIGDVELGEPV